MAANGTELVKLSQLKEFKDTLKPVQDLLASYPVGSIYLAYTSTSPASRFVGTWTPITGKFLYANASTSTGGSNTMTTSTMPAHTHTISAKMSWYDEPSGGSATHFRTTTSSGDNDYYLSNSLKVSTVGDSTPTNNNMPAYQSIYCWRRTA